jgi:hypothetical protein
MISPLRDWRSILAALGTFALGTAALYRGGVMTFLVPGNPGESFLCRDRLVLGILPLFAALALLTISGYLVRRALPEPIYDDGPTLPAVFSYCLLAALAAIGLVLIVAGLIHSAVG